MRCSASSARYNTFLPLNVELFTTSVVFLLFSVVSAMATLPEQLAKPAIQATASGGKTFVQSRQNVRPKPGYISGRVMDITGHPFVDVEFHIEGFPSARQLEWYSDFEPTIDPATGYYEIKIEDGAYRVNVRFSKAFRDYLPATVECLLMAEDFFTPDGKRFNQQPYGESRVGIVRDFIWKPDFNSVRKCFPARR